MSAAIDSHEMRKVVTVDIPGAYLQSKLHDDEKVFVVLRGKMAELLCQTDPKKYRPRMLQQQGLRVLHSLLPRLLYRRQPRRLWKRLHRTIETVRYAHWCHPNS